MSALDKIMDKENPNFIDTAIVYTAGKAWSLAQEAAEELAAKDALPAEVREVLKEFDVEQPIGVGMWWLDAFDKAKKLYKKLEGVK